MTQAEAIIEAFKALGGTRRIYEIKNWVDNKFGPNKWKDFSTMMADMVPVYLGGNNTSDLPENVRVLKRVKRGYYCLLPDRIIGDEIPDGMTEEETIKFWEAHVMSEKLFNTTFIDEKDDKIEGLIRNGGADKKKKEVTEDEWLSKKYENRLDLPEVKWIQLKPGESIIEHYHKNKKK